MKPRLVLLVISFLLFFPYRLPHSAAASPTFKIVVTYANFGERAASLYTAEDQGFFRKYGLDVQLLYVRSGAVGLSALAGGYSHFHNTSATASTLGAIAGGLDAVFVAGLINKLTAEFVVSPEIKTPSDLKGKTLGVTSIGGGPWITTMLALDHWGLDLKRDGISIRVIGDDSARAQAIATRIIDGAVMDFAFSSALKRQGYRSLADLGKLAIPFQGIGVLTRRTFVNQSPDIVEKVLRALVEAISFMQEPANKAAVMRSLAKGFRMEQVEEGAEGYERMLTIYDRRIYPNLAGFRNVIRLLGTTNEKIRRLKVEDIVDDRFVKKLEKEGLF